MTSDIQHNMIPVNNRAFLYGDSVIAYFYVRDGHLILSEDSYFYLMASMRKMRMDIPMEYTLEYFNVLFADLIANRSIQHAIISFHAYRDSSVPLQKANIGYSMDVSLLTKDIFSIQSHVELDIIKEITVNTNLLSNIRVHSPENIYAQIYAQENDLDDIILLNPFKRIARTINGNILLLGKNKIRLPKQSEGAYISPLMENFITYIHKNNLAEIEESEIIAFETQRAEEILIISDNKGLNTVNKIRNKNFGDSWFQEIINQWKNSFIN